MKKVNFSDFIFGVAEFSVSEGFPDEFIMYCAENKAMIHNLKRNGNEISGKVYFSHIKNIALAAERSGMKLEITERYGLPHIFYRYRKRYGIPLGLLLFTVITAILHSVIWSIEIAPTDIIPEERILEVLHTAGVQVGAFSDTVNCKDAEYLLYENFDDISWVNVRIAGTRMFVDISEVKVKEKLKDERYTNIIASKDGEIVNAEIFRGDGQIYPGTAVVRGDLLISGIINHRDGSVKFVDSEGKIYARTKNFVSSEIPSSVSVNTLKKCKDIYFPVFFGLSFADAFGVKSDNFTESGYFTDGGDVVFPLGFIRKHGYSFESAVMELSENEATLLCFRDFARRCLDLFEKAEILESDIRLSLNNGAQFSGDFLTVEDIALKKEFTVEDTFPSR